MLDWHVAVDLREQLQRSLGDTYRLERELGGGGMSHVFLAVETALARQVVVKVLLPELAAGVSVDRFRREIHLAAQLQHPHIVPLLAAGDAEGLPWFTMPYVTGESLRARLIRDGELPIAEAVRILRDIASALAYAHSQGVVHRDIKPDNVLISHGVAVVTDFGVAKALTVSSAEGAYARGEGLTSLGVSLGTPAYMAPEQASADPGMDHRVDVYAFGVTAYEMLTGQPPFWGRSPQAILGAHVVAVPEPVSARRPGIPPLLGMLVMKCLEKRPADRPQTAGDIIATLDMMTTPSGGTMPVAAHQATVVVRGGAGTRAAAAIHRFGPIAAVLALAAGVLVWGAGSRPTPSPVTGGPAAAAPAPRPIPEPPPDPAPPEPADVIDGEAPRAKPARRPDPPARPGPVRRTDSVVLAAEESALLARLRAEAVTARGRAVDEGVGPGVLARGDSGLAQAESLAGRGQVALAAARLSAAAALWSTAVPEGANRLHPPAPDTTPSPPPARLPRAAPAPLPAPDHEREIKALFEAYGAAIESRSLDAIRRAYPGLQPAQAKEWERFFEVVDRIDVELRVTQLTVAGSTAVAELAGVYVFDNPSTHRPQREPVTFVARLRREVAGWRIESLQ
jgi:serine/threonine-protein kinase